MFDKVGLHSVKVESSSLPNEGVKKPRSASVSQIGETVGRQYSTKTSCSGKRRTATLFQERISKNLGTGTSKALESSKKSLTKAGRVKSTVVRAAIGELPRKGTQKRIHQVGKKVLSECPEAQESKEASSHRAQEHSSLQGELAKGNLSQSGAEKVMLDQSNAKGAQEKTDEAEASDLYRSSGVDRASEAHTEGVSLGSEATFEAANLVKDIGKYELNDDNGNPIQRPPLCEKAEKALHGGCKKPEGKREAFLEKFSTHLQSLPNAGADKDGLNSVTNMLDFFGGDTELLGLYKEAVAEERNSVEFRDAVFIAAAEKQEVNPCPGQKMVMYIGGPSAAGKSFTRGAFVEEVKAEKSPQSPEGEPLSDEGESYVVSVDGGLDREMCQMRQIVLQAALAKGYAGIEDLHKNTKTSVKGFVRKAAMTEGQNMHVVIPATFISGFQKFLGTFRTLAKSKDTFQVFAEVRADHTTGASDSEANESFKQTIRYNGESRAYYSEGEPPFAVEDIKMNNRKLPCESKVYNPNYFNYGVKFSKKAKSTFKFMASSKRSLVLSNESDNMHVKKQSNGQYVQTVNRPTVKHISKREVDLWNQILLRPSESEITTHLKKLGLPDAKVQEIKGKILSGKMTFQSKKANGDVSIEDVEDLGGFQKFLQQNQARARLKITKNRI